MVILRLTPIGALLIIANVWYLQHHDLRGPLAGAFILILGLTGGGPGIRTEVLSLYAYHTAFQAREIGYGSSIAMIMLLINFVFAGVYLWLFRVERAR